MLFAATKAQRGAGTASEGHLGFLSNILSELTCDYLKYQYQKRVQKPNHLPALASLKRSLII